MASKRKKAGRLPLISQRDSPGMCANQSGKKGITQVGNARELHDLGREIRDFDLNSEQRRPKAQADKEIETVAINVADIEQINNNVGVNGERTAQIFQAMRRLGDKTAVANDTQDWLVGPYTGIQWRRLTIFKLVAERYGLEIRRGHFVDRVRSTASGLLEKA